MAHSLATLALAAALACGAAGVLAQPLPSKPTPVKFTEPKISRNMSPEMEKYYEEHPEEYAKAVQEEKALKAAVARHEGAMRNYQAAVQKREMEDRRSEIVARIQRNKTKYQPKIAPPNRVEPADASMAGRLWWGVVIPILALVFLYWFLKRAPPVADK